MCVDYQGFNIRLAKHAHALGVPVLFVVGPQIWASRPKRLKKYVRYIDHLAVIFPFEKALYANQPIDVRYIGHPLAKKMETVISQSQARAALSIDSEQKVLCLLPGSRTNEIAKLLPVMCESAFQLQRRYPNIKIIIGCASSVSREWVESVVAHSSLVDVE